jgi:uncharacterized membrane protein YhhN
MGFESKGAEALKFVLILLPRIIVLFFIVLPFLRFFFVPIFLFGGFIARGIGGATRVWIQFNSGGGAITFVNKNTIGVVTLDAGHSILLN